MNKLWRWSFDSRGGTLESYFTATEEEVQGILGETGWFGEVLGKHSDVSVRFTREQFDVISEDSAFVESFKEIIGSTGYLPFAVLEDNEENRF